MTIGDPLAYEAIPAQCSALHFANNCLKLDNYLTELDLS